MEPPHLPPPGVGRKTESPLTLAPDRPVDAQDLCDVQEDESPDHGNTQASDETQDVIPKGQAECLMPQQSCDSSERDENAAGKGGVREMPA
ncbi:hypothetical protein CCR75_005376 [Bremia lactucae]|uniref:Uncharacterized protein n=1 Tax=Bremia lactucae TaxID=4779 RepID=A0A976FF79_BRELC|nr:hypothetical protein CCR75_005376 [Bremia lactucae]